MGTSRHIHVHTLLGEKNWWLTDWPLFSFGGHFLLQKSPFLSRQPVQGCHCQWRHLEMLLPLSLLSMYSAASSNRWIFISWTAVILSWGLLCWTLQSSFASSSNDRFLITGKTVHWLLLKLTCYILVPCLCWLMSSLRQKGRKEKKSSVRKLASYSQSSPEFTVRKRKRIKIFKSFYETRYQIFTKAG